MAGDAGAYPSSVSARSRLTRQARDVLAASARGASVREVANELGVTEHEVCAVLVDTIHKLGTRSKLEAVNIAIRRGDIQP